MAILILPLITSKAEDTLDMDEMATKFKEASDNGVELDGEAFSANNPQANNLYNERMRGVVEDMYDLKYF